MVIGNVKPHVKPGPSLGLNKHKKTLNQLFVALKL